MSQQPPTSFTVVIADAAYLSGAFEMGPYVGGIVTLPTGWVAANIGFQVSTSQAGTYTILRQDDADEPVQIINVSTSASRSYKIPNDVFPALWVKLWSKSATAATETDVSQTGGPLSITLMLK